MDLRLSALALKNPVSNVYTLTVTRTLKRFVFKALLFFTVMSPYRLENKTPLPIDFVLLWMSNTVFCYILVLSSIGQSLFLFLSYLHLCNTICYNMSNVLAKHVYLLFHPNSTVVFPSAISFLKCLGI